ncbi:hypothetical protein SAQ01S_08950 [Sphingomonas aquatilis NBRC 16722]|nr:hypothetical protein SAQ01S_08950 [Sphingomonas aquatilis NBRC 16722]
MEAAPMMEDPSVEHYRAAVCGSVEAYRALREQALELGLAGEVSRLESLTAAECYAYLAASIGDAQDRRRLAGILIARADYRAMRGCTNPFFRMEAAHWLRGLADAGDVEAADQLDAMGVGPVWEEDRAQTELRTNILANFADAARGDLNALASMSENNLRSVADGDGRLEALVKAEQFARIGSFSGDPLMRMRLAGVVLLRREYELRDGGSRFRACWAANESVGLLLTLCNEGIADAWPPLANLIASLSRPEVALIAADIPEVLSVINPEGHA